MATKNKGVPIDGSILRRAIANGARVSDSSGNDITDDDEFLNQYAIANDDSEDDKERLKNVLGEIGGDPDTDTLASYVNESNPPQKNDRLRKLQAQADLAEIDTDRARNRQELDELTQRKNLRDANQSNTQEVLSTINEKVATPVVTKGQQAIQKIGSLPTVGSIGLLLTLLVILLFVVVQVNANGDTRIKLLFYMLMGRASLNGRVNVSRGVTGSGNNNSSTQNQGTTGVPKNTPILSGSQQNQAIQSVLNDIGKSNLNVFQQIQPGLLGQKVQADILTGQSDSTITGDFQNFVNVLQDVKQPSNFVQDLHSAGDDISFRGSYGDLGLGGGAGSSF